MKQDENGRRISAEFTEKFVAQLKDLDPEIVFVIEGKSWDLVGDSGKG